MASALVLANVFSVVYPLFNAMRQALFIVPYLACATTVHVTTCTPAETITTPWAVAGVATLGATKTAEIRTLAPDSLAGWLAGLVIESARPCSRRAPPSAGRRTRWHANTLRRFTQQPPGNKARCVDRIQRSAVLGPVAASCGVCYTSSCARMQAYPLWWRQGASSSLRSAWGSPGLLESPSAGLPRAPLLRWPGNHLSSSTSHRDPAVHAHAR
jgi:hypothetical protein